MNMDNRKTGKGNPGTAPALPEDPLPGKPGLEINGVQYTVIRDYDPERFFEK
ncbi:MAG: hypothetical protein GYA23_03030 [Methanomicrobiales archaeon]|nr:hypothetical protein [Methanomicrobiales archaeon]